MNGDGVRVGFLYMWYLYVLLCADGTYYTGITKDTKRRLHEHNKTKRGAKYTRTRRPVQLVYVERFSSHGEALRAERRFKRHSHAQKKQIVEAQSWGPDSL